MKKTSTTSPIAEGSEELREEYHFDYTKAKPNRFIEHTDEPRFEGQGAVSGGLKALMAAMPDVGEDDDFARRTDLKAADQQA